MDDDLVIFDGDCGFCSTSMNWAIDRGLVTGDVAPYQKIDPADYGLTPEDVESAVWLVTKDGDTLAGSEAIAALLTASRFPYTWLGTAMRLPILSRLSRYGYRFVAANRHRLPGATCSVPRRA